MHITSNSKSLLNEGRPNGRKDEEFSCSVNGLMIIHPGAKI